MTFFATALTRAMRDLRPAEIALAAGLPASSVYQYAQGRRGISVAALGELLRAFPDPAEQAALIEAHLKDETPASHHGLVSVICHDLPDTGELREVSADRQDLDRTLDLLRTRAESDPVVLRLLRDLEEVLR